jgi:hypothetical protein
VHSLSLLSSYPPKSHTPPKHETLTPTTHSLLPLWHLSTKRQAKDPESETQQCSGWRHHRRPKETLSARAESAAVAQVEPAAQMATLMDTAVAAHSLLNVVH